MSELVSVITPAFLAAEHIGEAIRSVIAQDHQDWEILVVDDGSPDETAGVVESFSRNDSRIRLIRQPNSGPAAARQRGLDEANGRYVAFLDADDYWVPEKLSRQLRFMRRNRAALGFTAFRRISEDGSTMGRLIYVPESIDYDGLLRNTTIATSTVMIDRERSGEFRMQSTYYDDYALWLNILRRGHVAWGLNEDLMRYRVVNGSVSRNKIKSAYWVWRLYRDVEGLPLKKAISCFAGYAFRGAVKYSRF